MDENGPVKKEMSFLDHLEALRWHLIRSAIVIVVLAATVFFYNDFVFKTVLFGPKHSDFITYRAFCWFSQQVMGNDALCMAESIENIQFNKKGFELINTEISGQFTKHIWISVLSGIILAFPYVLWEFWRFVKPALKESEMKATRGFVIIASFLFVLGICFAYFLIVPLAVNFLGNYKVTDEVANLITMDSYISLVTTLVLATGIVFELPVLVYFLTRFGIVTAAFMRKFRKHSIVVILIVAAIITPSPDVTSQLLVAVPLYLLYEVSIFVAVSVERKRKADVS
jgi:sec-independent protein translocase protein TatC